MVNSAERTRRKDLDDEAEKLSPAWLGVGGVLFAVALAAPIAIVQIAPDIDADPVRNAGGLPGQLAEMEIGDGQARDANADKLSLGQRLSNGSIVPGRGAGDIMVGEHVDQIVASVREPSSLSYVAQGDTVVRRHSFVLDQMYVALESDPMIGRVETLRLAALDCYSLRTLQGRGDGTPSTEEGVSLGSHVSRVITTIGAPETGQPVAPIPGPMAQPLEQTYPGLKVQYCPGDMLVGAIEINRILDLPEDPTVLISELRPNGLFAAHSDVRIAGLSGSSGLSLPAQSDSAVAITGPSVTELDETAPDRPAEPATIAAPAIATSSPDTLLAMNGNAYAVMDAFTPGELPQTQTLWVASVAPEAGIAPDPVPLSTIEIAVAAADETELGLSRTKRRELQIRLGLIGFDPRGADGIFGPRTRDAISALQVAEAIPATGYMDGTVRDLIEARSRKAYRRWIRDQRRARQQRRATSQTPVIAARTPAARNAPECARDANGVIIENQSWSCDVTVLEESLQDLFSAVGVGKTSG